MCIFRQSLILLSLLTTSVNDLGGKYTAELLTPGANCRHGSAETGGKSAIIVIANHVNLGALRSQVWDCIHPQERTTSVGKFAHKSFGSEL